MASLVAVSAYIHKLSRIGSIADWPNALNGLQLENSGRVSRIGAAVDACQFTIEASAERGIDLLLVHHGLYWQGLQPLTAARFRRTRTAIAADLAIYSAHLPLDLHPRLGNNALLCKELGLKKTSSFLELKGSLIGLRARVSLNRGTLVERLARAVGGPVKLCPGGPKLVRNIGVVTGGAGSELARAAAEGIDTFITGEGSHWTYTAAEELGVNLLYGGHYATETFGVRALAENVGKRFKLPWEFIDHPTGL